MKKKSRKIISHELRGYVVLTGILLVASLLASKSPRCTDQKIPSNWIVSIDSLTQLWASDTLPDINTAEPKELIKAGVPYKFSYRIKRYISDNGPVYSFNELYSIYQMNDSILDIIKIETTIDTSLLKRNDSSIVQSIKEDLSIISKEVIAETVQSNNEIDINIADSTDLVSLRGIGPVFSKRILSFRNKLGGFCSIEQVKETYGLPEETFESVKGYFVLKTPCSKLKPNTDSKEKLAGHLYIPDWMAEKIIRTRKKGGPFNDTSDLKSRVGFKEPYYSKLKPYLVFDQ